MAKIQQVKKRDGRVVDFEPRRIENAIQQASIATDSHLPNLIINDITRLIIEETEEKFTDKVPGVEDIQDVVEQKLVENNFFDVAKAYILYRREREEMRRSEEFGKADKTDEDWINVKKRDGSLKGFDNGEIRNTLTKFSKDIDTTLDLDSIVKNCKKNVYDGITTSEINQVLIMVLRAQVEYEPVFSLLATRVLFNDLYKEILNADRFSAGFSTLYQNMFERQLKQGVSIGRLDPRLLVFDIHQLIEVIRPERDDNFRYLGAQTLYDRYFLKGYDQSVIELPQYFWMRIAMGLAIDEKNREEKAIKFYNVMSHLHYVPSTPTLFHSGTTHPQMSSCYLTTVEDNLAHIFKCIGDNAQLAKWSGGIGNDWTNIRATGSTIRSTNVNSQGVIPFLKIVDSATGAINRSGKRRGATCVYLETWHYDIEDFIDLRKNTGDDRRRTHDTNTANWIPDLFMKRVLNNEDWVLFSPDEVPDLHHVYGRKFEERYKHYERKAERGEIKLWRKIKAIDLWRKMVTQLYETGHPWITFKDPCNIRSPQSHIGTIHSSNLCTEITLNTSRDETAVCNLGSINISNHIYKGKLDRELLQETIKVAMRMLDNVIDLNFYPTPEAENSNLKHRPIGLGLMGFQDALYKMDLQFDSVDAVEFSDDMMEFISFHSILTSSEIAREKGCYESFSGSKWDQGLFPIDTLRQLGQERDMEIEVDLTNQLDWSVVKEHVKEYGMRNSNCMAIAPTATIANISDCFPSIEPIYKNIYAKSNLSGEFTMINCFLIQELSKEGLWNREMLEKLKYHDGSVQAIPEISPNIKRKYKEVFEIDPVWLIKHAAVRGKWIDQSQSLNIFTPSVSGKQISDIYFNAWRCGIKTTYYLRTLGASAVEKSTIDINKKFDSVAVASVVEGSVGEMSLGSNVCNVDDEACEACQ